MSLNPKVSFFGAFKPTGDLDEAKSAMRGWRSCTPRHRTVVFASCVSSRFQEDRSVRDGDIRRAIKFVDISIQVPVLAIV